MLHSVNRKKHTLLVFLVFICSYAQAQQQSEIVNNIQGKWYVVYSSFPMWLSGKKTNPSFNYSLIAHQPQKIKDEVLYTKNNKTHSIKGIDTKSKKDSSAFIWRGSGVLKLFKSKWSVLYLEENKQWMIISFEKTLATPAGIDVVCREKKPSEQQQEKIKEKLDQLVKTKNPKQTIKAISQQ